MHCHRAPTACLSCRDALRRRGRRPRCPETAVPVGLSLGRYCRLTLHVANTGPAYPLRAEFKKGPYAGLFEFSEYGAPLHITAPSNAINFSNAS